MKREPRKRRRRGEGKGGKDIGMQDRLGDALKL